MGTGGDVAQPASSAGPAAVLVAVTVTVTPVTRIGDGTPAPWDPPAHLVTTGVYAPVRLPVISGVATVLLGATMAAHSFNILLREVAFVRVHTASFGRSEEPGLERRFEIAYRTYAQNVPGVDPRDPPLTSRYIDTSVRHAMDGRRARIACALLFFSRAHELLKRWRRDAARFTHKAPEDDPIADLPPVISSTEV